jgi:Fe-S-cluster formation regulator IscX/YfhJ
MKSDIEKERLTYIQLTSLKEHYDDRYLQLREAELEDKFGALPTKVQDRVKDIISDKIITEDEFAGMEKWLMRLRDSKDFNAQKKEKLQEVLKDWIDENVEDGNE